MNGRRDSAENTNSPKKINSLETRRSFLKKAGLGTAGAAALWAAPQMTSISSRPAYASITGVTPARCVVLFDEDTIDNDAYSLLADWPGIDNGGGVPGIAQLQGTTGNILVNENNPVAPLGILPPLPQERWQEWNRTYSDDPNLVLLAGGQVNDEGVFTLPNATPQFLADFMKGDVTAAQLNGIDVCALRNNSLRSMIGMDCIGVVYDDDINVGDPKVDNLNKEV